MQRVQAKATLAASDNTVTLTWDGKTRMAPSQMREAFEFSTSSSQAVSGACSSISCTLQAGSHYSSGRSIQVRRSRSDKSRNEPEQ